MNKLKSQLRRHEGLRLLPYECSAGKLTIGYGRNLEDKGISVEEAEQFLDADITDCIKDLERSVDFFGSLDEVRQDVLINMCFNLGIGRLLKFKNMLAALSRGDFKKAAAEMLDSKWARQVGGRAIELSLQMKTGKYGD